MDVALLPVLRDGLLRQSEASSLRWGDVEIQEDGAARIHVLRSKPDPEAEDAVLYIGPDAAAALLAIMPEGFVVVDPSTQVFGLSASQIGRRVNAAAKAAGLGDGFTGHSGRVCMAQDLTSAGVELPALMNAGRWKNPKMPARYTEGQAAGRGRWPDTNRTVGGLTTSIWKSGSPLQSSQKESPYVVSVADPRKWQRSA